MLYAIPQGAPLLIVHAHSNGCDIGDMREALSCISESLRVHVMSFEFPGYGLHMGSPNMRSIDDAVSAVMHYLLDDLKLNPAQLVWYGRSIGSGPAIRAAHRITRERQEQPGGLIVQCGFASFGEVAGHLFGRVASHLVSPLWPNEAMMKELHCPVLLLHGRADTMIPIEQSERLWNAVKLREPSKFHACDCGHNDFNFQRCMLRPIYDFLVGLISIPSFPAGNFKIEIASSCQAFVHHLRPLRAKIPVYSFRWGELDEAMRLLKSKNGTARATTSSSSAATVSSTPSGADSLTPSHDQSPVDSDSLRSLDMPSSRAPSKKRSKGNGKKDSPEPLPVPLFCEMPPIKDVREALSTPEGMMRTCALRVDAFLERLQRQLERVDVLESKPIDEVVDFLKGEFWACDPLLGLWEEVHLPQGDWARIRLGPFFVDSSGESGYDPGIGSGSVAGPNLLRVPLKVFCPSPAQLRYLSEWSLLHCDRLAQGASSGGTLARTASFCCAPCGVVSSRGKRSGARKRSNSQRRRRNALDSMLLQTRGALVNTVAAQFVNLVDKSAEVKAIFANFVELHNNPAEFRRKVMSSGLAPSMPCTRDSTIPPLSSSTWSPGSFCAAAREHLREDSAFYVGPDLSERYAELWDPERRAMAGDDSPVGMDLFTAPPPLTQQTSASEGNADWLVSCFLLQYERLLRGVQPCGSGGGDDERGLSDDAWGCPLRPDLRSTGLSLNKAMKAFADAEHRERSDREHQARVPV